jgi:hypothetical protein
MEIGNHWDEIRKIFEEAYKSCFHYAVATVNPDGTPHVTPIGGLALRDDRTGYYFEEFPSRLPLNLKQNPRVCVMAINADKLFWGKALMDGRFPSPPGVRLLGSVGEAREGTREEIDFWQKKIGFTSKMKGYKIMWEGMRHVRDIQFDGYEPIYLGAMMAGLE